jgi:preprotein translocase subunit SecA
MQQDHDPKRIKPTGATMMLARLAQINRLEPTMENLSHAELQRKTDALRHRVRLGKVAVGRS